MVYRPNTAGPGNVSQRLAPEGILISPPRARETRESPGALIQDRYRLLDPAPPPGILSPIRSMDLPREEAVSLVLFPTDLATRFPEAFLSLRAQVRALQTVRHPFLTNVLNTGESGGRFFFVEEWPAGETLSAVMERKRENGESFTPETALGICRLLFLALCAGGRTGPHGFLNPQEIFLEPWRDGPIPFFPKLAKAGMRASLRNSPLTFDGLSRDMPCYAAPEFAGTGTLDAVADVYSLGAVLYSLLTLQPPTGCFVLPTHRQPRLPGAIDRVVLRALEEEPGSRFASPEELVDRLALESGLDPLWAELAKAAGQLVLASEGEALVSPCSASGATAGQGAASHQDSTEATAGQEAPSHQDSTEATAGQEAPSHQDSTEAMAGQEAASHQDSTEATAGVRRAIVSASGGRRLGRTGALLLLIASMMLLILGGWGFWTESAEVNTLSRFQGWESFFRDLEEEGRR